MQSAESPLLFLALASTPTGAGWRGGGASPCREDGSCACLQRGGPERLRWGLRPAVPLGVPDPVGRPAPGPCSASCAGHFEAAGVGSGGGRPDSSSWCSGPAARPATGDPGAHLSRVPAQPILTSRLPLPQAAPVPAPVDTRPPRCRLPETGLNAWECFRRVQCSV